MKEYYIRLKNINNGKTQAYRKLLTTSQAKQGKKQFKESKVMKGMIVIEEFYEIK
jgi:hypothetical protein